MTDIDKLRAFAQDVLASWPEDLCGADVESYAVKHGLLIQVEMQEPCGESCQCAEMDVDFPTTCYRRTPLLTGEPR